MQPLTFETLTDRLYKLDEELDLLKEDLNDAANYETSQIVIAIQLKLYKAIADIELVATSIKNSANMIHCFSATDSEGININHIDKAAQKILTLIGDISLPSM